MATVTHAVTRRQLAERVAKDGRLLAFLGEMLFRTALLANQNAALAAAWQGDNTGPATSQQVAADFKQLQDKYPQAKILASTFDAFFKIANEPSIKAQLPVVTEEIGDGWLYGVPSDPLKNAQVRKRASFAMPFYTKNDRFTKTGSGQT